MKSLKILIADDEQEFVTALVERLSLRGFTAEGVTRGDKAITRVTEDLFDVVLLDVKMPGMSCLEVVKKILEIRARMVIILMTGYGSTFEGEEGLKSGAHDFLAKPININELVRKIQATVPE